MRTAAPTTRALSDRAPRWALAVAVAMALTAPQGVAAQAPSESRTDSVLAERVAAAIEAASDVPADSIRVGVSEGVVSLTGSVVCDDCGGTSTPGGTGTVQQSLGAVVRAVPGVREVRFYLRYRRR